MPGNVDVSDQFATRVGGGRRYFQDSSNIGHPCAPLHCTVLLGQILVCSVGAYLTWQYRASEVGGDGET